MDNRPRTDSAEYSVLTDSENNPEPEKKNRAPKKIRIAIAGAALALMVATGVGCNAKATEQPSPSTTEAPANPSSTSTTSVEVSSTTTPENSTAEGIPTVESLELDASLLDNPEALMKELEARIEAWFNAGATPENAQAALRSHVSMEDYATKIAAEYDPIFIEALFAEGWESNPILARWVNERLKFAHSSTLALYFLTAFPDINPKDKEPYKRTTKISEIVSGEYQGDGSLIVVDIEADDDNEEMNRVGEKLTGGKKVKNEKVETTRTFVNENGTAKISDILLAHAVGQ